MSEPLQDLRTKVSPLTNVVLEARARATGRDKAEIAREVLHAWASVEYEAASVMQRLAAVEGIAAASKGR